MAPIPIWLSYLLNGYSNVLYKIFGVILVAIYMVFKGRMLVRSAVKVKQAFVKLLQSTVLLFNDVV